ncbi:MAG: tripartite tricarboxylate transporter substrate binding protein [Sutterellaceae bacterium]|nr:tripartite tricarboxylate transporter substrate binding protein [Sutterellaceae bacterium]
MQKRTFLSMLVAGTIAAPLSSFAAWAPSGEINVIVAYKAGSGTDTGARLLASEAEKVIGRPLVINNVPGADGKIGWTQLSRARPDGRTIGFINLPNFFATHLPTSKFVPICNHLKETAVVVVKADSKWKTLKDLVAEAKKNPNLRASTNGVKASNHIAAQLFAKSAGFNYKAIPYGGTADQLLALRQSEVQFSCAKVGDVLKLATGSNPVFRVLGVFDTKRDPTLKNVPTLAELGYYNKWFGSSRALVAPAGTPPEIVNYYVNAFRKVMTDKANIAAHAKAGLSIDFQDNKQLAQMIKEQETFNRETVAKLF